MTGWIALTLACIVCGDKFVPVQAVETKLTRVFSERSQCVATTTSIKKTKNFDLIVCRNMESGELVVDTGR